MQLIDIVNKTKFFILLIWLIAISIYIAATMPKALNQQCGSFINVQVAITQLRSMPHCFNNKRIIVSGFYGNGILGPRIYDSREDLELDRWPNSIAFETSYFNDRTESLKTLQNNNNELYITVWANFEAPDSLLLVTDVEITVLPKEY